MVEHRVAMQRRSRLWRTHFCVQRSHTRVNALRFVSEIAARKPPRGISELRWASEELRRAPSPLLEVARRLRPCPHRFERPSIRRLNPRQLSALFSTHAAAASAVSKPVLVTVKPVPERWFR